VRIAKRVVGWLLCQGGVTCEGVKHVKTGVKLKREKVKVVFCEVKGNARSKNEEEA